MDKTINQYINQLHLDPKREAAVRKLIQSISQSSGGSNEDNSGGSNTPEPEFVDLGLPSGTLWCSCNLGANSPEEPGNLYMWGDPTPYTIGFSDENNPCIVAPDGSKLLYEGDIMPRYKHFYYPSNDWEYKLSKYNAADGFGTVDYLTELQPMDDAAYLYNKEYRTPNIVEINELMEHTSSLRIWHDDTRTNLIKLTSNINDNYIYVHDVNYCSTGIMWANSLIRPDDGDANYDIAAKMYASNGNNIGIGSAFKYTDFYRYQPTFIRPVKYGNSDSKSIINIDLQYLVEYNFKDCIAYAKLVNGYITRKPVFDVYSRSFIKITNFADNTITAQLETTGDVLNEGKNLNIICREFEVTSNGKITFITQTV